MDFRGNNMAAARKFRKKETSREINRVNRIHQEKMSKIKVRNRCGLCSIGLHSVQYQAERRCKGNDCGSRPLPHGEQPALNIPL